MNGRVYAPNRERGMAAIETELHGFTIIELLSGSDVEIGDEISWESDLKRGPDRYENISTTRSMDVLVHSHLVSRSSVRQQLA